jgi:hypothetical protein
LVFDLFVDISPFPFSRATGPGHRRGPRARAGLAGSWQQIGTRYRGTGTGRAPYPNCGAVVAGARCRCYQPRRRG